MSEHTIGNTAKRKLAAGELILCMGLRQARTPDIALIAAACGFDAVYIDMEHSSIATDTAAMICTAALGAGITPLVRVPGQDVHLAARMLDGGALGIIFPHIETAEQASAVVAACRHPPLGHRSVMGAGPALGYRAMPLGEINQRMNAELLLIAMLETSQGVANAETIAATRGIDMLLVGANDLSTELGIPGELRHARLHDAFEQTAAACKAHGKVLGIGGVRGDLELQSELYRMGSKFIIAGSDVSYLSAAARSDANRLRDALERAS